MNGEVWVRWALLVALPLVLGGCADPVPPEPSPSSSLERPALTGSRFPFVDVTAVSGLDFVHANGAAGRHHYLETMGPGVALFDADGDTDLDIYVVNGAPLPGSAIGGPTPNRLYLNRGDGTFTDATEASGAGDLGYGMGCAVGDADGDSDLDLYVLNYGANALLFNDGQGRFERQEVGVEDPRWSVSGAFFDADSDMDLDLYVVNYLAYDVKKAKPCKAGTLQIYCSPEQYPPTADRLYRNEGGRFLDVAATVGVLADGRGMGLAVADFDADGDQDLYVTNDRSPNFLYLNDGGRFREVATESGVGYGLSGQSEGGMGVVVGDFTGRGEPSVFLTNFQKEPNRFYVAAGGGFFDDLSLQSGLGFPTTEMVGWGIAAVDVEGDGDLDLVVANGHVFDNAAEFIPGSAFALPDQLFLNNGQGRFQVREFPGPPLSSRGLASGDLDGDGDPDLVTASCGGPLRVWRNEAGRPEGWLVVELRTRSPNSHAFGARLEAQIGGRTLSRRVAGGGSYASHSDTRIYLGLGESRAVDRAEVRWPDGSVEVVSGIPGGRHVVWRQGEGIVSGQELIRRGGGGA